MSSKTWFPPRWRRKPAPSAPSGRWAARGHRGSPSGSSGGKHPPRWARKWTAGWGWRISRPDEASPGPPVGGSIPKEGKRIRINMDEKTDLRVLSDCCVYLLSSVVKTMIKYFQSNLPVLLSVIQMFICPVSLNVSYQQDFDRKDTLDQRRRPMAAKCCHRMKGFSKNMIPLIQWPAVYIKRCATMSRIDISQQTHADRSHTLVNPWQCGPDERLRTCRAFHIPGYSCPAGCDSEWWRTVCPWCPPPAAERSAPRTWERGEASFLGRKMPIFRTSETLPSVCTFLFSVTSVIRSRERHTSAIYIIYMNHPTMERSQWSLKGRGGNIVATDAHYGNFLLAI